MTRERGKDAGQEKHCTMTSRGSLHRYNPLRFDCILGEKENPLPTEYVDFCVYPDIVDIYLNK